PWHRGANGPRPSTPRDGGLDRLAPSAGMADAARSKPVVAAEFAQSARNGVAIQAGDTRHQGDATIPLLLGQQGDQLATTMLISPSDQSVDGAMVLCRDAVRMLSAGRARAAVQFHRGVLLAHWCSSPCSLWQEDSSIAILPKPAEVIFAHRLRWWFGACVILIFRMFPHGRQRGVRAREARGLVSGKAPSNTLSEGQEIPAGAKIRPKEEGQEGEKCLLTSRFVDLEGVRERPG